MLTEGDSCKYLWSLWYQ